MKKIISAFICFALVFAFAGSALAVGVYKTFSPGVNYSNVASGTRTETSKFTVQISVNSNFNGNPDNAGINFRAMRGTNNGSYAVTLKSCPGYKSSSYIYNFDQNACTYTTKVNLTSNATNTITFSGYIYF